jgi:hypothetical protein
LGGELLVGQHALLFEGGQLLQLGFLMKATSRMLMTPVSTSSARAGTISPLNWLPQTR